MTAQPLAAEQAPEEIAGTLTPRRRRTLDALVRTVLPHLTGPQGATDSLLVLVETRLHAAPPDIAAELLRALDALGSRFLGLLITGRASPFPSLEAEDRERAFAAWADSAIPVARSVHQALRRFVLSTWYATPEARAELGVPPPLHARLPAFPWEGALRGQETLDSEPVARVPAPATMVPGAHPPRQPVPATVTTAGAIRGDRSLTTEVVVVGSGAGGAVAAARLAEAGHEVVILEEGEYLHAPDFTEDEGALMPRLFADQALRATVDGSILLLQGGAVGGGSTVNWMLMLRAPDEVLDSWGPAFGVEGMSAREMAPVFDLIEAEVHAREVPADAHAPSNRVILDGARALGWRASPTRINAAGCVRAGTCSLGCRYDAKQSALLTYLPRAFAAGARLFAGARVARVEVLERAVGRAGGGPSLARKRVHAEVRDPVSGEQCGRLTIDAPIVVLAAGAVGTPVILERSGLGGGGVGRYLRLQPTSGVMGVYDREMYPFAGVPQSMMCDEFLRRDTNGFGFWIECPALQPALGAAALSGFGAGHRQDMLVMRRTAALIVLVRDGSGESGSQGSVWLDRGGRTRIRYQMTSADRANLAAGVEACARLHLAAGALEAVSVHARPIRVRDESGLAALRHADYGPNRVSLFSAHVNGTCRLGVHPATSGTTPTGERHGVRGLYVCDGSLLPTSLGVNPQETIMAMASVVARGIAERRW
ncbi:MAG TPA: GMC family oxidoreductase [Gemmatimonadaceae bacterium]|nr:GMC family oxidoreductase [Gemmatimonadaceae bacterium]